MEADCRNKTFTAGGATNPPPGEWTWIKYYTFITGTHLHQHQHITIYTLMLQHVPVSVCTTKRLKTTRKQSKIHPTKYTIWNGRMSKTKLGYLCYCSNIHCLAITKMCLLAVSLQSTDCASTIPGIPGIWQYMVHCVPLSNKQYATNCMRHFLMPL